MCVHAVQVKKQSWQFNMTNDEFQDLSLDKHLAIL